MYTAHGRAGCLNLFSVGHYSIPTTWSAFVLPTRCIPMKSSCIPKQYLTHRMQIISCSLLDTSAVSPATIDAFWMFGDICRITPRAIDSRSSFWISGDVYFSGSFPKPHNDLWIFLSPKFQQLMKIGVLLRHCFSVPVSSQWQSLSREVSDRIESKIFLFLLFSNACRSDNKSPISAITVLETLRLVWTNWYVYKDLIWRAESCVCRFQFASYCCRWFQIIFISGLFFDSDCFFDYTRLCVTSAWFYPQ